MTKEQRKVIGFCFGDSAVSTMDIDVPWHTLISLSTPKLSQAVHREECTRCFENQDSKDGIALCLYCFNGSCLGAPFHHAQQHRSVSGHRWSLHIARIPKPTASKSEERRGDGEPPAKMTKLAIPEPEQEADKYDFIVSLAYDDVVVQPPEDQYSTKFLQLKLEVMASLSSARQSEVKAWEEDIVACEHTLMLQPSDDRLAQIGDVGEAQCSMCTLKENLWLCLNCGSLGCGRQQFGNVVGGNGHGLEHFKQTGHPVAVKLGTITPEGSADIYCYICDDSKLDPSLAEHLSLYGINIVVLQKTQKSLTELQIEQNLQYDFSMTDEKGNAMKPVFGPSLTGLKNLGNSCYLSSTVQALFSLSSFKQRYSSEVSNAHWKECTVNLPAECVECQMLKISDGLLSGRYSHPSPAQDPAEVRFQDGLALNGFKALVGKGHNEFASMKQQDAEEFLVHLVGVLRRDLKRRGAGHDLDPTTGLSFKTESRIECLACHKVKYTYESDVVLSLGVDSKEIGQTQDDPPKPIYEPVALTSCVDAAVRGAWEIVEGWKCPGCGNAAGAKKTHHFCTFPEVLVIHAKKFKLVNWVPAKLNIPVITPSTLHFDESYLGRGLKEEEVELPENDDDEHPESSEPQLNANSVAQLESMGFPLIRCQKALMAVGGENAEAAMEWLFGHMDDPDIDTPLPKKKKGSSGGGGPSAEQVQMLVDMGFVEGVVRKALGECDNNPERAIEWLFSHPDATAEPSSSSETEASTHATVDMRAELMKEKEKLPAQYRLKAFISHKGPSVHSGHYVVHIHDPSEVGQGWVLFNDEKVVHADDESVEELKKLAYVYVFVRT